MGNSILKMASDDKNATTSSSPDTFTFHPQFEEDSTNGLCFKNIYLPEEIVMTILTHLPPKEILQATLVCKKWCNIIKSDIFWFELYSRIYRSKPKKLPWYVYYAFFTTDYFNRNLIKNGNGEERFNHWNIVYNYGDEFKIENPPNGSDPLPEGVLEFNNHTSCFATSYYECNKFQQVSFANNRLMQFIFNKYKPHIYLSEWVSGRFDCGCVYTLWCKLYADELPKTSTKKVRRHFETEHWNMPMHVQTAELRVQQWEGKEWSKVRLSRN